MLRTDFTLDLLAAMMGEPWFRLGAGPGSDSQRTLTPWLQFVL